MEVIDDEQELRDLPKTPRNLQNPEGSKKKSSCKKCLARKKLVKDQAKSVEVLAANGISVKGREIVVERKEKPSKKYSFQMCSKRAHLDVFEIKRVD